MRMACGMLLLATAAVTLALGAPRVGAQTGTVPPDLRAAFKAADKNGDGRLSLQEEVNALLKDFDAADVNKDGALTYEEFEAYVKGSSR